ncbi:MAG: flagellar hook-associated protein FlgL [Vallitalea sp.]|jgi:flagellar hook-associated protein 3 FlgL|nr:flagellar hook-associated protein FlgL [Vallitalea sp.]
MRVTNSMVTNNILLSLNRSKLALSIYEEQLATGKKIQRPSDDPIIAVRALKLRASVNEIEQYRTNAEDALSWMTVAEKSISNVIEIVVKRARSLCVQAANGPLGIKERQSIVTELKQLKDQIADEGNVDYAGRHVFTGYKTDKPLTYTENAKDDKFTIEEKFGADNIEKVEKVFNSTPPRKGEIARIRVSYSKIKYDATPPNDKLTVSSTPSKQLAINSVNNSTDANAYEPLPGTVNILRDTGEIIFNKDDLGDIKEINFTYDKEGFENNDLNPIHYFKCTNKDTGETYENKRDVIKYQVSYNQNAEINTLGKEFITTDLMRDMEEMINEVGKVKGDGTDYDNLLKDSLRDKFDKLIGKIDKHKENLLKEQADLGTRMNRVELTITRLEDDKLNFTDLMTKNESIDIAEVIVNMKCQQMVYDSALMSSTKVVQSSLLDFLR